MKNRKTDAELREHIIALQQRLTILQNLLDTDTETVENKEHILSKIRTLGDRIRHAEGWLENRELLRARVQETNSTKQPQIIGNLLRQKLNLI